MSIFSRLKRKVANKRDDDVTAGARLRRIMTAVPRPPQSTNPISGPMRGVTNDGGVIWNETAYESEHLAYSRRIQDQNRSTFVAEAAPGSSNQGNDVSTETALQPGESNLNLLFDYMRGQSLNFIFKLMRSSQWDFQV